jgi:hypothetical protein
LLYCRFEDDHAHRHDPLRTKPGDPGRQ